MTKLYTASYEVNLLREIPTGEQHAFFIYDPDGDPTSGDERVFRGGPPEGTAAFGENIFIETWTPISKSEDGYYLLDSEGNIQTNSNGDPIVIGDPVADNNITDTGLSPTEVEAFKRATEEWAAQFGEPDDDNRIDTGIPYQITGRDSSSDGNAPGVNSNSTFYRGGEAGGLTDIDNDYLPRKNGTGPRLSPDEFAGRESDFNTQSGEIDLQEGEDEFIANKDGDNVYVYEFDIGDANTGTTYIWDKGGPGSNDILKIVGVDPNQVRFEKVKAQLSPGYDVHIYMPGDVTKPSIIIKNQFDDGSLKLDGIQVEPPYGQPSQFLPLNDPDAIPIQVPMPVPDWLDLPVGDVGGWNPSFGSFGNFDPLVIDVDNDGLIELSSVDNSTTWFDFWGDGMAERTGWVNADDGLLVWDKDADGRIETHNELFGSRFPLDFVLDTGWDGSFDDDNGFAILAEQDSNADGMISALDTVWSELQVWRDLNQDGISTPDELVTLDALGIASIDVSNWARDSFGGLSNGGFGRIIEGNTVTHSGFLTMTDGSTREVVDVWFENDARDTVYDGDYTLDIRTLFLPTARGYGLMPDLHIAMSNDNGSGGLLESVQSFATGRTFSQLFSEFDTVKTDVRAVLMDWARVDEAATPDHSRFGLFEDFPEYFFLRQIAGLPNDFPAVWFDDGGSFMPITGEGVEAVFDSWNTALNEYSARLVFQSGGAALFESGVNYNSVTDTFDGTIALSQTAIDDLETAATGHADIEGFWHFAAQFIDHVKGVSALTVDEVTWLSDAVDASSASTLTWADIAATLSESSILGSHGVDDVLTGTRYDDFINGFDGNDTLIGGDGNDHIVSWDYWNGVNDDILIGGKGNDILEGGYGDDTYVYDYGHDVIVEIGGNFFTDADIIEMDAGINPYDVTLHVAYAHQAQPNFFLDVAGRGTVTIQDDFASYSPITAMIDEIHFDDGTIFNIPTMHAQIHGTERSELVSFAKQFDGRTTMYGYGGDDTIEANYLVGATIDGGDGNDTITGGLGDDIVIMSNGIDTFWDQGGTDTLLIPDGFTINDINLVRTGPSPQEYFGASIIVDGLGTFSATNHFQEGASVGKAFEIVELSDGTQIDLLTADFQVWGTDGDDEIYDNWPWPNMDDIYVFGLGQDTIFERYGGDDTLKFENGITFSDLSITRMNSTPWSAWDRDLIIEGPNGNSTTFSKHFDDAQNTLEKLTFADGSTILLSNLEIDAYGTDQNDQIRGVELGDSSPNDTIYTLAGNDTVFAESGDDIVFGGERQRCPIWRVR